jgi:hypothetical protein
MEQHVEQDMTLDFENMNHEIERGALYLPPHYTALETFLVPWAIATRVRGYTHETLDETFPFRFPTSPTWMKLAPWLSSVGAEAVGMGTVGRLSASAAAGIDHVLFMEAGHNRDHGHHEVKTGALVIGARAQILRDALRAARNWGDDAFWSLARQNGITGWKEEYLRQSPHVIDEDVMFVPTSISFYPLIDEPKNGGARRIARSMAYRSNNIELITHELALNARHPTVSVHLLPKISARTLLGEEYEMLRKESWHSYERLLESPFYRDGKRGAAKMLECKAAALMRDVYRHMTWSMDHVGLMALERHVGEGNGPMPDYELAGYIGDAMRVVLESGERHLSHINEHAVKHLYAGYLTPSAEDFVERCKRLGILSDWSDVHKWYSVHEALLHYAPQTGSKRLLSPAEVARNDLRRFGDVLEQYGLDLNRL